MQMGYRRLQMLLLILAGVLALSFSAAAATSLSISLTTTSVSPGDALLMSAAAMFFGVDTNISMQFRADTGSATSAISLFYLSGESQTPPQTIVLERKKGRGWGALAKGKMPPGLAGKWKNSGDPFSFNDRDFETGISIHFLSTYYAVPEDSLILWVRKGISIDDLALCLNLSAQAKVAPTTVVSLRLQGQSWTQLTAKYKTTLDRIKQPAPPKAKYGKPVPVKPIGNNNSKGNGGSPGKGKGKGK